MALPDTVQRRRETFDFDHLLTTEAQEIIATGNGAIHEVGVGAEMEIVIDINTITGTTPVIDITVEGAVDLAFTVPVAIQSFPQQDDSVDPLQLRQAFKSEHEFMRLSWIVAGTSPSFFTTASARS
jgi:hypothetical protein